MVTMEGDNMRRLTGFMPWWPMVFGLEKEGARQRWNWRVELEFRGITQNETREGWGNGWNIQKRGKWWTAVDFQLFH